MKLRFTLLFTLLLALPILCVAQTPDEAKLLKKAQKIHEKAFTLDTHADTPMLFSRPDFNVSVENDALKTRSKVDFPRMRKGGLDAIFWAVYLGQGPRTPEGHATAKQRALDIFDSIDKNLKKYPEDAALALTPEDGLRIGKTGKRAIYIGVENGYPMGQDLSMLQVFYDKGARYMTLCHSANNDICDSSTDPKGAEYQGLSKLGEQVVAEMNRLGMVIDISHVSDSTFYDVIRLSKAPIVATHSCARALCDVPRNLTDDMLRALAKNNGVIQLNLLSSYVKTPKPNPARDADMKAFLTKWNVKGLSEVLTKLSKEDSEKAFGEYTQIQEKYIKDMATVKDAVDHIDHFVKIMGIDHVGIGADFDGGGALADCFDVSQYQNMTIELVRRGYSAKDINKIWSGNFFRVMKAVQKVAQ
jgi:membrane dipeptidase